MCLATSEAQLVLIACKYSTDTPQMQYRYVAKAYYLNIKLGRLSTSLHHQFKSFKLCYPKLISKFFTYLKLSLSSYLVQLASLHFFVQALKSNKWRKSLFKPAHLLSHQDSCSIFHCKNKRNMCLRICKKIVVGKNGRIK